MSVKQREHISDTVIDLTRQPFFVDPVGPTSKILLTLPDRLASPARAAQSKPRRWMRLRADVDAMTVLGITVVLAVGTLMLTLVAAFKH